MLFLRPHFMAHHPSPVGASLLAIAVVQLASIDRSHALRGNTARDAPRSASRGDAERHGMHSHAERGNDQ
ncbi:hypothetical protein CF597_09615 [Pseudomonas sp. PSB1]|nr:hypothetical protein [Pseudomonas sp. PSB1]